MALSRLVRLPNGLSKTFWPRYRDKRARRLVKDRENDRCHLISFAQPRGLNRVATLTRLHRFRNLANLISVTTTPASPKKGSTTAYVPSFLVSHVMSLAPTNLLTPCYSKCKFGLYLHHRVLASESHSRQRGCFRGFNIIRRDRVESEHGGVCMYI